MKGCGCFVIIVVVAIVLFAIASSMGGGAIANVASSGASNTGSVNCSSTLVTLLGTGDECRKAETVTKQAENEWSKGQDFLDNLFSK